jgi:hypothetical protein
MVDIALSIASCDQHVMLQSVLIFVLIVCQACNSESLGYALPRSMAASSTPCSVNMTYEVEMPDGVKVQFASHIFPRFSPTCLRSFRRSSPRAPSHHAPLSYSEHPTTKQT